MRRGAATVLEARPGPASSQVAGGAVGPALGAVERRSPRRRRIGHGSSADPGWMEAREVIQPGGLADSDRLGVFGSRWRSARRVVASRVGWLGKGAGVERSAINPRDRQRGARFGSELDQRKEMAGDAVVRRMT